MGEWLTVGTVDVQEGPPTSDQLSSILDYLGPSKAGSVVKDATGSSDAQRKFKANESAFQRPVVVDWNNGRVGTWAIFEQRSHDGIAVANVMAVTGDNESEIMNIIRSLPKETDKV